MNILQSLENRIIAWGWNKWCVSSVRNWKTSLAGLLALLVAIGHLIAALSQIGEYVQWLSQSGQPPDMAHIQWAITLLVAAFAGFSAKDGDRDVALDANGKPIPKDIPV